MTAEVPSPVAVVDLLDAIEYFLTGPEHADQEAVLKEREPLTWQVALALNTSATKDDIELRMLGHKLELESLIRNPDVLLRTAQVLYERLLQVAPQFP